MMLAVLKTDHIHPPLLRPPTSTPTTLLVNPNSASPFAESVKYAFLRNVHSGEDQAGTSVPPIVIEKNLRLYKCMPVFVN